jgi:hypothetical protein
MGWSGDLAKARTELLRAQRERVALQNARLLGDLVPRELVLEIWERVIGNARARLLAIPAKLAGQLGPVSDPAVIRDKLEGEIGEALSELTGGESVLEEVSKLFRDRAPAGSRPVAAPAKADSQRVGGRKPKAKPRGVSGAGPVGDQPG